MDCIINMSSSDSMEDYSDMPPLVPIKQVSNLPMEMYYKEEEVVEEVKEEVVEEVVEEVKEEVVEEQESFEYDGIELINYVNDFIDNQEFYYDLIKSYCEGNNVELYIQDNKSVVSGAYLDVENKVHEFSRNNLNVNIVHDSVWKWVNDYNGNVVTSNKLMNSVFIGNNFVSLWRVIKDASEEKNIYEEDKKQDNNEEDNTDEFKCLSIIMIVWLTISVYSLYVIYLN